MGLLLQEIWCSSQVLKTWRLVQETSEENLFTKSRQQLDLARITISEFPVLKFGLVLCNCLGFLFSQPLTYIRLISRAITHGYRDQETYFLYVKLLRLYAIGFCDQVLPNLHYWWSEALYSQQQQFKLLELVTSWDPCKGLVKVQIA